MHLAVRHTDGSIGQAEEVLLEERLCRGKLGSCEEDAA